jgi:hypothetical protein
MFADDLGRDGLLDLLHERRSMFAGMRDRLAGIEPGAHRHGVDEALGRIGPRLVHDYGLSYLDAVIEWCDVAIADVTTTSDH